MQAAASPRNFMRLRGRNCILPQTCASLTDRFTTLNCILLILCTILKLHRIVYTRAQLLQLGGRDDFSPVWPDPTLDNEQRLGAYSESYIVYFDTDSGDYPYSVSDFETFQQFEISSEWTLEINSFGVVSVSK